MAQPAGERVYSVAEARARFSELIAAAESGETVVITRRGEPVVELSARRKPRKRLPVGWLTEQTSKMRHSDVGSADVIRQMRDERY